MKTCLKEKALFSKEHKQFLNVTLTMSLILLVEGIEKISKAEKKDLEANEIIIERDA